MVGPEEEMSQGYQLYCLLKCEKSAPQVVIFLVWKSPPLLTFSLLRVSPSAAGAFSPQSDGGYSSGPQQH